MNIIKELLIKHFSIALLWQDENFDGICISAFDKRLNQDINDLVDSFVNILDNDELLELRKDPSNFGHWLCLEQMGHGSGFYDSTNEIVSNISDKLESANLYRPSDLYMDDDVVFCDFFKYGSK